MRRYNVLYIDFPVISSFSHTTQKLLQTSYHHQISSTFFFYSCCFSLSFSSYSFSFLFLSLYFYFLFFFSSFFLLFFLSSFLLFFLFSSCSSSTYAAHLLGTKDAAICLRPIDTALCPKIKLCRGWRRKRVFGRR